MTLLSEAQISGVSDAIFEIGITHGNMQVIAEGFSPDEYQELQRVALHLRQKLPRKMSNTKAALKQAQKRSDKAFKAFAAKKVSAKIFATYLLRLNEMLKALMDMGDLIVQRLEMQQVQEESLSDDLSDENVDFVKQVASSVFSKSGFLNRLFGKKKDWFGLTPDGLADDLLSLSKDEFVDTMAHLTGASEGALLDQQDLERIKNIRLPGGNAESDPQPSDNTDEPETRSISKKQLEDLTRKVLGSNKRIGKSVRYAPDVADTIAKYLKDKGIVVSEGLSQSEKSAIQRWRELAGINLNE